MKKSQKQRVLPKNQLALEQCIFFVGLFCGVTLHALIHGICVSLSHHDALQQAWAQINVVNLFATLQRSRCLLKWPWSFVDILRSRSFQAVGKRRTGERRRVDVGRLPETAFLVKPADRFVMSTFEDVRITRRARHSEIASPIVSMVLER